MQTKQQQQQPAQKRAFPMTRKAKPALAKAGTHPCKNCISILLIGERRACESRRMEIHRVMEPRVQTGGKSAASPPQPQALPFTINSSNGLSQWSIAKTAPCSLIVSAYLSKDRDAANMRQAYQLLCECCVDDPRNESMQSNLREPPQEPRTARDRLFFVPTATAWAYRE